MIHTSKIIIAVLCFSVTVISASAQQQDARGFKDPALFTRMPNYQGAGFEEKEFDGYDFQISEAKRQHVEGHFLSYTYYHDDSRGPAASPLQIVRNYENAAQRTGGKVLFEDLRHRTTLLVSRNGQETWASIGADSNGAQYDLVIIERQTMKQDVVANAEALQGGLVEAGHVEVPGIFFDFNKSEIKPESQPALEEVAKMLKASPSLRVYVVGHTDSVGMIDANMKLSGARAGAVVKALVANYGISAARLKDYGVGPLAPVASNDTEEGRAKNRRVELVKQ